MKLSLSPIVVQCATKTMKSRPRSHLFYDMMTKTATGTPSSTSKTDSLTRVTNLSMSFDDSDTLVNTSLTEWTEFTPSRGMVDSKMAGGKFKSTDTATKPKRCISAFKRQNARRSLFDGTSKALHSKLKSAPIASSTMIEFPDETILADDISIKIPNAQSTMINEFLPRASSTMLQEKLDLSLLSTRSKGKTEMSEVETWSIDENRDTVLHRNYLRRYQISDNHRLSRHLAANVQSSADLKSGIGLDVNSKLAGTKSKESKIVQTKEKPKFPLLGIAIKNVKQGMKKRQKTETRGEEVIGVNKQQVLQNPEGGLTRRSISTFQVQDKQAVARKIHRFRESFRRNDLRRLHTLATL